LAEAPRELPHFARESTIWRARGELVERTKEGQVKGAALRLAAP
jgi:hypothetical protein